MYKKSNLYAPESGRMHAQASKAKELRKIKIVSQTYCIFLNV